MGLAEGAVLAPHHWLEGADELDAAVVEADLIGIGTVITTTNLGQDDRDLNYDYGFMRIALTSWLKGESRDSLIGVGRSDQEDGSFWSGFCNVGRPFAAGERVVFFVRRMHPVTERLFGGAPFVHWELLEYPFAGRWGTCMCDRQGGTDSVATAVRRALYHGSLAGLSKSAEVIVMATVDTTVRLTAARPDVALTIDRVFRGTSPEISAGNYIRIVDWNWREIPPGRYLLFLRLGPQGGRNPPGAYEILPAQGAPWNTNAPHPAFGLTLNELTRQIESEIKKRSGSKP